MVVADPTKRREYQRLYRIKNRSKLNELQRGYARRAKERTPGQMEAYARSYYLNNKEVISRRAKDFELRTNFGISLDEYEIMASKQSFKCAICKKPETKCNKEGEINRLSVDHDHKTGKVRRLLCDRCNLVLGRVDESVELLTEFIRYINEHS